MGKIKKGGFSSVLVLLSILNFTQTGNVLAIENDANFGEIKINAKVPMSETHKYLIKKNSEIEVFTEKNGSKNAIFINGKIRGYQNKTLKNDEVKVYVYTANILVTEHILYSDENGIFSGYFEVISGDYRLINMTIFDNSYQQPILLKSLNLGDFKKVDKIAKKLIFLSGCIICKIPQNYPLTNL